MSVKSMISAVFLLILCIISQTRCDLSRVYLPTAEIHQPDSFPATFKPVKLTEFTTFKPFSTTSKPLQISYNPPHPFPTLKPLAPVYKPQPLAPLPPVPSLPFNQPIQHDFPIQPTLAPLSPKPNFNIPPSEQLPQGPELDNYLNNLFHDFMRQYKREYIDEPNEMAYRYDVFRGNFFTLQEHTKSDHSAADYSITEFADLTNNEFERILGWDESLLNTTGDIEEADIPSDAEGSAGGVGGKIPEHYDQREENLVTRVKNQGDCACCWAFVTTAVVEGLCAKRIKKLQEFSEQSLLDCDKSNYGCKGGVPENAVKHIAKRDGLELETVYPYEYGQSTCRFEKRNVRVKVAQPVKFKKNDEEGMKRWLYANGPIAVAINAAPLKYYKGGVLNPTAQLCSPKKINHAVTIIGYGVENSTTGEKLPYWIVKNSWAAGWGENGFFRIARGKNACGLALWASSAKLSEINDNCLLKGA